MKKRIASMLLTVCLCLTLLPTAAMAEGTEGGTTSTVGYTTEGFCTAYEWVSGELKKADGRTCSHTDCNGYQPATPNSDGVYEIGNAGQLYWFAAQVNQATEETPENIAINGKLTDDITVNSNVLKDDGTPNSGDFRQWTPIIPYYGTFDGDGKTIFGLYYSGSDAAAGLFAYVGYGHDYENEKEMLGTVKNVRLEDSYFYSERSDSHVYVGGIAAYNLGTITNCTVNATVSGKCTGYQQIAYVGGIAGYSSSKSRAISLCANFGAVSSTSEQYFSFVGGIVGYTDNSVTNCYNTGSISDSSYHSVTAVGGVVGDVFSGSTTNCYSIGTVSSTVEDAHVGGVAGEVENGSVSNCYWQKAESDTTPDIGQKYGHGTITNVESKTAAEFQSGAVAWLLNGQKTDGVWKQTLTSSETGTNADTAPTLDSTHGTVYHGYVTGSCREAYSNSASDLSATPTHNWGADGKCKNEGCTAQAAAKIGDNYYATFSEAYEAAKDNDTITLLANVKHTTLNRAITLTIDLNGMTWEHTENGNLNVSAGKYTIQNGTVSETVILTNAELKLGAGFKLTGDYQLNIGSGAVLKVTGADVYVRELCVASDSFTCDLTRGKFGTVRISDGVSCKVIDLLDKSYAFRTIDNNPTIWYDQYHNPDVTSIQNVMVNKKWITGVTLKADKESYIVGETVKLTASVEPAQDGSAGIYYEWYKDDDETYFARTLNDGNYPSANPNICNYDSLTVGTHTIYVKVTTHAYTRTSEPITVTVAVDDKTVPTVTAPTAITGLTYNGTEQTLITAGSTTGGTLQYKLGESGTWSETLPTGKDATGYTVYYRVVGDSDYANVAASSISVTIEKKAVTVKPKSYTITRGNAIPAFELEYDGLVDGDTLNSTTAPAFTCYEADGTTAVSTFTAAGRYTITWTNPDALDFSGETNYTVTKETTGTLTIHSKPSSGNGGGSSSGTTSTTPVIENSMDFSDVRSSDYFYDAVQWASSRGITGGISATKFGPHDFCTRAQLVTFLWRAAGQPMVRYSLSFSDVGKNDYYTEAVRWAASLGIVDGYGNDLFGADDPITREQVATILYRFARYTGMDTAQGGMAVREYRDYESVSNYAVAAIQWAVNAGIMQGHNGNLMPGQPCTRAQIVTMLYRLLGE